MLVAMWMGLQNRVASKRVWTSAHRILIPLVFDSSLQQIQQDILQFRLLGGLYYPLGVLSSVPAVKQCHIGAAFPVALPVFMETSTQPITHGVAV